MLIKPYLGLSVPQSRELRHSSGLSQQSTTSFLDFHDTGFASGSGQSLDQFRDCDDPGNVHREAILEVGP
jgi:hypothetical protein